MVQESHLGSEFPDSEDRSWKHVENKHKYEKLERIQQYVKDSPSLALNKAHVPDIDNDVFKSDLRKLHFPESSAEFGVKLTRKVLLELSELDHNKRKGYSMRHDDFKCVLQASVAYYVSKTDNIPVSIDKIADLFNVEKNDILTFNEDMKRMLELPVPVHEKELYYRWIEKIAYEFSLSTETQHLARDIARRVVNNGLDSGRSVLSVVAGIIYFSAVKKDEKTTQTDISNYLNISTASLRNHYQRMSQKFDGG